MENEAKIERIKTLMENFGVTQSEFAKRISIDASNFSKHLTGKLPVSDSLINRIVADLGVSKEGLCTGKGYMFRPSDNDIYCCVAFRMDRSHVERIVTAVDTHEAGTLFKGLRSELCDL